MIQKNLIKSAPDVIVKAVLTLFNQGKFEEILSRSSYLIEKYPNNLIIHNQYSYFAFHL